VSNISVAEILKIHGKWIEGKPFAEFIAQKKRITERHAYNLIKDASEHHEILRSSLQNRTVLYGLSEFGPPKFEPSTEEKPSEVNPYVWLNEKERRLYRLDVEGLNIIKRMAAAGPEWVEWVKREEEEFRQKWGIVTP